MGLAISPRLSVLDGAYVAIRVGNRTAVLSMDTVGDLTVGLSVTNYKGHELVNLLLFRLSICLSFNRSISLSLSFVLSLSFSLSLARSLFHLQGQQVISLGEDVAPSMQAMGLLANSANGFDLVTCASQLRGL